MTITFINRDPCRKCSVGNCDSSIRRYRRNIRESRCRRWTSAGIPRVGSGSLYKGRQQFSFGSPPSLSQRRSLRLTRSHRWRLCRWCGECLPLWRCRSSLCSSRPSCRRRGGSRVHIRIRCSSLRICTTSLLPVIRQMMVWVSLRCVGSLYGLYCGPLHERLKCSSSC